MKWRKEPNTWINYPLRFSLSYQERDAYMCLRAVAGQYNNENREGYVERSNGIPYTTKDLSAIIGEPSDVIQSMIDKAAQHGVLDNENGCLHFLDWEGVDKKKQRKVVSPKEQEYWDRGNFERLASKYPDALQEAVDKRIIQLANEGKIIPRSDDEL